MQDFSVKSSNRDRKVAARRGAQPADNRRSIRTMADAIAKRASQPVSRKAGR